MIRSYEDYLRVLYSQLPKGDPMSNRVKIKRRVIESPTLRARFVRTLRSTIRKAGLEKYFLTNK